MIVETPPSKLLNISRKGESSVVVEFNFERPEPRYLKQVLFPLLYLLALVIAIYGCSRLRDNLSAGNAQIQPLENGLPYLALAVCIWLLADLIDNWQALKSWQLAQDRLEKSERVMRLLPLLLGLSSLAPLLGAMQSSPETVFEFLLNAAVRLGSAIIVWLALHIMVRSLRRKQVPEEPPAIIVDEAGSRGATFRNGLRSWIMLIRLQNRPSLWRIPLVAVAALASLYVWESTASNQFTPTNVAIWLLSWLLWARVLAPVGSSSIGWIRAGLASDWNIPLRKYWWAILGFALIMLLAAGFRLVDLHKTPGEINNDMWFFARDAIHIYEGKLSPVYLSNNAGRQSILAYGAALLAKLPGLEPDLFITRRFTALASLLTLPLVFWLGYECVGRKRHRAAILMGLLASGLMAASYWDAVTHRLGLNISFAHPVATLFAVFIVRSIRHNRRADFIVAGGVIGFGLFTYHSARILPLAAVAAVLAALVVRRSSREEQFGYAINFAAMSIFAVVVAIPILRYWQQEPNTYWLRATHTIVNEQTISEDPQATSEYFAARIMGNARKYLGMFHYNGDNGFELNVTGVPALDIFSGALLILGLPAYIVYAIRTGDRLLLALPFAVAALIIPALAVVRQYDFDLAPHFGRILALMPFVYLLAALALFHIIRQLWRAYPARAAFALSAALCCGLFWLSYQHNTTQYFVRYHDYLLQRTGPGREGGEIFRGIIDTGGQYNNIFLVMAGLPEGRFIKAESGHWGTLYVHLPYWSGENQISSSPIIESVRSELQKAIDRPEYPLDMDEDLYYLFSYNHEEAIYHLRHFFPNGLLTRIPTSRPNFDYGLYRVPALGEAGIRELLALEFSG